MANSPEPFNPLDPTGMLKEMRDTGLDQWCKIMSQMVQTDTYSESTGRMLDAWLSSSTPFRKMIDKSLTQALSNLKLPSTEDLARLSERLTNIEMRLDDMDAKLDNVLAKLP